MSLKLQAVGLALIAFTGCASPSDRFYQEAMARYYILSDHQDWWPSGSGV